MARKEYNAWVRFSRASGRTPLTLRHWTEPGKFLPWLDKSCPDWEQGRLYDKETNALVMEVFNNNNR